MGKLLGLLDSNVVIASIAEAHEHHEPSNALFDRFPPQSFAVADHSYAEAYSILTRRSMGALFGQTAADTIAALESVAARTMLIGLTHGQTFDAIRDFAADGGIGPRLYDRLIGQTGVVNGVDTIVTWNLRHMRSLFPAMRVVDPAEMIADRR